MQAQFRISLMKMNFTYDVTWKEHLDIIMKGKDKLSDRTKFSYKMHYYFVNGDEEFYKKLALRQVKLYPYDIETHEKLSQVYWGENIPERYDNAISEYKTMLDLDPEKYELYIDIGNAFYGKSDFINAIKYYTNYSEIYVEDPHVLSSISSAHWQIGNHKESINILKEAILLSNEELYLKRSLLKKEYLNNNIKSNEYIDALTKLLKKILSVSGI